MTSDDRFDLERFVTAQAPVFETVFAELRAGRKRSHWMWVCLSSVAWSRTILDGSVLRHRLHRRSACVSCLRAKVHPFITLLHGSADGRDDPRPSWPHAKRM